MKNYKSYQSWFKEIRFLKDKIILPDGRTISKDMWTTSKGFNSNKFNKFLKEQYNIFNEKE